MRPVRQAIEDEARAGEPEAIRGLSKVKLHEQMAKEWFLPDNKARGITRQYLVAVYTDQVFRVAVLEMQRFCAELHSDLFLRIPFVNSADIKAKVEVLLDEQERRPLGYAAGIIPEEEWLLKVARILDQTSSASIFVHAVPNPQVLNTITRRMEIAKNNACDFLLRNSGLLNDKRVLADVTDVWESQKRLINKRREVLSLQAQLREATEKQEHEALVMQSALSRASLTVFRMGTGNGNPDAIFLEDNVGHNERLQLSQIQRL